MQGTPKGGLVLTRKNHEHYHHCGGFPSETGVLSCSVREAQAGRTEATGIR